MKRLLCGILVLAVFFLAACSEGGKSEFQTVLDEANALHKAQVEVVPEGSIRDYLPEFPEKELGFTEEELTSLTEGLSRAFNVNRRVTYAQAEQDVELLFRAFKYCYAPYTYFGGDTAFGEAKTAILNDLTALKGSFKASELVSVLRKRLAFIEDGHFCMNGKPLIKMQTYFSTEELAFEHDKRGYFAYLDGEKQYLLSVNGDAETGSYMKLSIGPDGGLIYRLGMLGDLSGRSIIVNAAFENTTVSLRLDMAIRTLTYDTALAYTEDREGTVPVVAYRDCMQHNSYEDFLSSAERLRGEPVAIIDLRGNRGGGPGVVEAWLNAYDPEGIAKNCYGMGFLTSTTRATCYLTAQAVTYNTFLSRSPQAEYAADMQWYRNGKNEYKLRTNDLGLRFFDADGLLFVLMDSNTMSGGEWLLSALRARENTVFVGMNSAGMLRGGTFEYISLPNSNIFFSFGFFLLLHYDDSVFQEGRGFLPDIWVNGDALERTKALIEHYGLTAS